MLTRAHTIYVASAAESKAVVANREIRCAGIYGYYGWTFGSVGSIILI